MDTTATRSRVNTGLSTSTADEDVYSDPVGALAVKNGKAVQDCEELHLAGRGITKVSM